MMVEKVAHTRTSLLILIFVYPKCRGGDSRVSSLKFSPECPVVQHRRSNWAEPAVRGNQSSRDSRVQDNAKKIIQDELQSIRKNLVGFLSYFI